MKIKGNEHLSSTALHTVEYSILERKKNEKLKKNNKYLCQLQTRIK